MAEPVRVEVAGKLLTCQHCRADVFQQESVSLDQIALGGLFHFEGISGRKATIYACTTCGLLQWFFAADAADHTQLSIAESSEDDEAEDPPEGDTDEVVEYLSCGQVIPSGAKQCPSCGWSWADPA